MKTLSIENNKYRIIFDPSNNDRVERIYRHDQEIFRHDEGPIDALLGPNCIRSILATLIALAQGETRPVQITTKQILL